MTIRKMIQVGIALTCLALLTTLVPSVTSKSLWRSTRWFEDTIDKETGASVPTRYRQREGEPSPQELTDLARKYGVEAGDVNEMVPVDYYTDVGSSSQFGLTLRAKYPGLADRLGYMQIVATRAKAVRYLALLIFLAGCGYLLGALCQTYQAEKDIPDPHLRL